MLKKSYHFIMHFGCQNVYYLLLAKFGVSEVIIANLLNETARLDALFFIIRTKKLKTLGKWPGVLSIWLDSVIYVLATQSQPHSGI